MNRSRAEKNRETESQLTRRQDRRRRTQEQLPFRGRQLPCSILAFHFPRRPQLNPSPDFNYIYIYIYIYIYKPHEPSGRLHDSIQYQATPSQITDGILRGPAAAPAPAHAGQVGGGGGGEGSGSWREALVVASRRRLGRVVGRGDGGGRAAGGAGGAHDRGGAAAAHDAAHLHRHGGPPRRGPARRRRHRQLAHKRLRIQRPRKPN
jgi:hypothetical protein